MSEPQCYAVRSDALLLQTSESWFTATTERRKPLAPDSGNVARVRDKMEQIARDVIPALRPPRGAELAKTRPSRYADGQHQPTLGDP
jgi:hypothetical protein